MPVTIGVPEIVAPDDPEVNESPAGRREPAASDHVYGAQPPVAERVVLYAEFRVAFGSGLAVVMFSDPGAMVRLKLAETLTAGDSVSVTVAVTGKVPTWQDVPEMVALGVAELNVKPEGNPEIAHIYGTVPPAAVTGVPLPEAP